MNKKLKEFYITIKETLERSIIVKAENEEQAIEYAEDLCNDDIVELNAEDFTGREVEIEDQEDFVISKSIQRFSVEEGEYDG